MTEILVLGGVSGSGKSVVGRAVATALRVPFLEGDDLHDPASIETMRRGVPLTEADRGPWLARIRAWIDTQRAAGHGGVVACSALTRAARSQLRRPGVTLLLLRVPTATIAMRLVTRQHAFMPASLLESQLDTFEPPHPDEGVIEVDGSDDIAATVRAVLAAIGQPSTSTQTS